MRDNNTSSWSVGLKFVQWGINTTYHDAIKMEPHKAMFGQPPKVGLGSKVPQEFLATISNGITEEDINELLKVPEKINVNDYHKEQKNEDEEIENTVPEANISVAITEDSINNQEVTEDTSFELMLLLMEY
nr:unnamed protein product [Callosobruchus chinensis]